MSAPKVAIVAALEREIARLVRSWPVRTAGYSGREFRFFENASLVAVCGGIGAEAARRASEAVIALYSPELLISTGFAGGLERSMLAGRLFFPASVIDASDGSRNEVSGGSGILISLRQVASREQKEKLAVAYGAQAVDMEAAAVGRSAQLHGIAFRAIKAISDTSDQDLPSMDGFIRDAEFLTGKFAVHVGLRPWLWPSVMKLSRNSRQAAQALCNELAKYGEPASNTGVGKLQVAGVQKVK